MAYFKFENKKVYYRIVGQGAPLLLLHGNTVSSKMFAQVLKKYAKAFQVTLIDFPGHGKSERLKKFETDFWYYNALATNALIEYLGLEKVSVVGTSGGALVAINLALEYPDKVKLVLADSFEGEYPLSSYIDSIEADRERDKKKLLAKLTWWYCHGAGWKQVVDLDTEVNVEFAKTGKSFFHRPISELTVPTLMIGSKKDEYCSHLDEIYAGLKQKNPMLEYHLFETGKHPAMLSNKEEFLKLAKESVE